MKTTLIGLILLLLIFALPISAQDATFIPTDCPFDEIGYDYTCGMMTVPENHLVDNGETIQLAIAVIHSNHPNPQPDPVMYLAGGPGRAFVAVAPSMPLAYNFNSILTKRDVIIVDQRGMGLSQPTFSCVPFTSANDAFELDLVSYQQHMAECLPRFENEGIDWQAYTSEQNAADLALVPSALGYDDYNIFGQSYGTLLGQIMLRDYPQNIRTAVLDSVVSLNANGFESSAQNNAETFARIEATCQADAVCNWAYPNLRDQLNATYQQLRDNPVTITVDRLDVSINGQMFADFVTINMRDRNSISRLPALITAFAEEDYDIVVEFVEEIVVVLLEDFPNQALLMTMVCPHNAPYTSVDNINAAHSLVDEPFRMAGFNATTWLLCQSWQNVPPANRALANSDVPTLLLGGEYDVLTPSRWAQAAAENLPNATVVSIPYTGHLTNSDACVQGMILAFFDEPTQPIDTTCTEDITPPAFILHTTVTRSPIQWGAGIFSLISLFAIGQMLFFGLRDLGQTAWCIAFKKQGWLPLISLVIVILLVWTDATILPDDLVQIGVVQAIVPLLMALQASAVFSPSDEPALEVQLASSRSILWLVVERLIAVILTYSAIAIISIGLTLLIDSNQNSVILWLGWLPPALFLSGLGVFITIRSRMVALGVLAIGFLWFIFGLFAPFFIPGQSFPAPFHVIQPFMWSIHVHASLEHLTVYDFWLNRIFLSVTGISLMMAAVYDLRDTEKLLLGVRSKSSKALKKVDDILQSNLKPSLIVEAVHTRIVPIQQIIGIAKYSFIMRWRSRGLKVFTLTPLAVFGIFMLALGDFSFIPGFETSTNLPLEQFRIVVGEMITAITSAVFFVPALYLYPILVADTIPTDERYHVRELLNGLPVAYWVTLVGRVLGTILAGGASLVFTMIIVAIAGLLRYGQFYLSPFIDLSVGILLAMSLLTAISILLGATQSSGRRAVALAIAFLILPEFLQQMDTIALLFPSRIEFFLQYIQSALNNIIQQPITSRGWTLFSPDMRNLMLGTIIQTLIIALIAWAVNRQETN